MANKTSTMAYLDEGLRQMVSQSVQQSENLRETVRDLTLQALKARELNLRSIKGVLKAITEGPNLGMTNFPVDPGKVVTDALAGMNEALVNAVRARHLALEQWTSQGLGRNARLEEALDVLGHLEQQFLESVQQACKGTTGPLHEQWVALLKYAKLGGTDVGALAAQTLDEFRTRITTVMEEPGAATLKTAQAFHKNFATLASGILIGLSEPLKEHGQRSAGTLLGDE